MLLGTHNALVLWDDGKEIAIDSGRGIYYGITWGHRYLYAVARANRPSRLIFYEFSYNCLIPGIPPVFIQDAPGDDGPHQAFWLNDCLFVANTQYNCIDIWDEVKQTGHEKRFDTSVGLGDVDHINSLWRDPMDRSWYVVEHRHQHLPKRIRRFRFWYDGCEEETIDIDHPSLAAGPTQKGLHNVFVEGGKLYTLGPSGIILYDMTSHAIEIIPIDGVVAGANYLRGLAVTSGYFLVGASNANPKDARGWGTSHIHILDHDLRKVDEIELDECWGQLMEIRVIDEPDLAHNLVEFNAFRA